MKKIYAFGLVALLASCGGGSSSSDSADTGEALDSSQETQAGTISKDLVSGLTGAANFSASVDKSVNKEVIGFDCDPSGTFSIDSDTSTITFDACVTEYDSDGDGTDDTTISNDGTLTFTENDPLMTIEYDLESSVTEDDVTQTSAMAGTMEFNTDTGTATLDISGTFDGTAFTAEGTMTLDGNNLTEDICLMIGSSYIQCTIDAPGLDVTTATPDDYAATCTAVSSCSE